MKKIKIAIAGVTGYSGRELKKILDAHEHVEIVSVYASSSIGERLEESSSVKKKDEALIISDIDKASFSNIDAIFFCTPHGFSMQYVSKILSAGVKIIDLSADYRFNDADRWKKNYDTDHKDPINLKESIYGLPELFRDDIKISHLVAVPGCYPTASLLSLMPIMSQLKSNDIIIDAKSGYSGAGKAKSEGGLAESMKDNFKVYSPDFHRHEDEIKYYADKIMDQKFNVSFVPHLLPHFRGEYITVYVEPDDINKDFQKIYEDYYVDEKLVKVLKKGTVPEITNITGMPTCEIAISAKKSSNKLIINAALDNLLKGAASQAVQCFNLMHDIDEFHSLKY